MAVDLSMPVLVVDDYKTMVRIVQNLLKTLGFTDVRGATSGAQALDMMAETPFGLVISDWNMEPMSGLGLLKRVRAHADHHALPFIMVTAESKTDRVIAAKEAGVSSYIVKPFDARTLKRKIAAVMGGF